LCLSYGFSCGGQNFCFRDVELIPQPSGIFGRAIVPTQGDSGGWVLSDDQPAEWAGLFFGEDGKLASPSVLNGSTSGHNRPPPRFSCPRPMIRRRLPEGDPEGPIEPRDHASCPRFRCGAKWLRVRVMLVVQ
jgi:hypothetical protein